MNICEKCGKELSENAVFCENCGASVEVQTASIEVQTNSGEEPDNEHSPVNKKLIIIGAAAVAAVVALIIALYFVVSGNNGGESEVSEVSSSVNSEESLHSEPVSDESGNESEQGESKPVDSGNESEQGESKPVDSGNESGQGEYEPVDSGNESGQGESKPADSGNESGQSKPKPVNDGKSRYIYEKYDGVYYFEDGKEACSASLPYSVLGGKYLISCDDSALLFLDGKTLYLKLFYEDGDYIKIAEKVDYYRFSPDSSAVLYITSGCTLYRYSIYSGETEEVATKVYNFIKMSDDGRSIVYSDTHDDVHLACIADKTDEIIGTIDECGEIFASENFNSLYFIKDGSIYYKKAGEESISLVKNAVNIISANAASGSFYYLKEDSGYYTVCCFSNGSSVDVAKNYDYIMCVSNKPAAMVVRTNSDSDKFLLIRNFSVKTLDVPEKANNFKFSPDGKTLYFTLMDKTTGATALYKIDISRDDCSAELLYDGVARAIYTVCEDGTIIYGKDEGGSVYSLYADGAYVDSNVPISNSVKYYNGVLYYQTADNKLKSYTASDGVKEIAEDTSSFYVFESGKVLFFTIGDSTDDTRTLNVYHDNMTEKIDDEVVSVYSSKTVGSIFDLMWQ